MTKYQAVGIGNAVVDVITRSEDSFLDQMGIEKGIMQLVERDRAESLYDALPEGPTSVATDAMSPRSANLDAEYAV